MRPNDPRAVLEERTDRSGGPDACWPWTAARSPFGYGKVRLRGRDWRAHRLAYAVWVGPLPDDDLLVCHTCDNPPCCNPAHLFVGTHLDNQRDKWAKGRGVIHPARGEASGTARLTAADVLELRRRYAAGESSLTLAMAFGIDKNTVLAAASGATWRHIPGSVGMRPPKRPGLTVEQIEAVRAVPGHWGVNAALARRYGVSAPTIARARAAR